MALLVTGLFPLAVATGGIVAIGKQLAISLREIEDVTTRDTMQNFILDRNTHECMLGNMSDQEILKLATGHGLQCDPPHRKEAYIPQLVAKYCHWL